jgi:hypothetical protein
VQAGELGGASGGGFGSGSGAHRTALEVKRHGPRGDQRDGAVAQVDGRDEAQHLRCVEEPVAGGRRNCVSEQRL